MTHIGFTGTSKGMTQEQARVLRALLFIAGGQRFRTFIPGGESFHHGDCVGADAEAHEIARAGGYFIVGHPPENDKARAYTECDHLWKLKPYLERNKDIVDLSEVLIAAPYEYEEIERSGTWSTIRYAKKNDVPRMIIFPNGNAKMWRWRG